MKKNYEGPLRTPIKPRKPRLLAAALQGTDELTALVAEYSKEDLEKLLQLCSYYGIQNSPGMFYGLALALATEFVPGFQEKVTRGRDVKWSFSRMQQVHDAIERLVDPSDRAKTLKWAAKQVANCKQYKDFVSSKESANSSPDPAEVMRKIYYEFKRRVKKIQTVVNKMPSK